MTIPHLAHTLLDVSKLSQEVVDTLPDNVLGTLIRSMRAPGPDPVADFESSLPLQGGNFPEQPGR